MSDIRKYMDITDPRNRQDLHEGILDKIRDRIFGKKTSSPEENIKAEVDRRVKAKADSIYQQYVQDFAEAGVAYTVENTIVWLHRFDLSPQTIRAAFDAIGIDVGSAPEKLSGFDDVEELTAVGGLDQDPTTGGLDGAPQEGPNEEPGQEEVSHGEQEKDGHEDEPEVDDPDLAPPGSIMDARGRVLRLKDTVTVMVSDEHIPTQEFSKRKVEVGTVNRIGKNGIVMVELPDSVVRFTPDQIDAGLLHKGKWTKEQILKWMKDQHMKMSEGWKMIAFEARIRNPSLSPLMESMVTAMRLLEGPETAIISKGKLLMLFEIILYLQLARKKGFTTTDVTPHSVRNEYMEEIIQDTYKDVLAHARTLDRENIHDSREEMNATYTAIKGLLTGNMEKLVDQLMERARKSRRKEYYILVDSALSFIPSLVKQKYGIGERFLERLLAKMG